MVVATQAETDLDNIKFERNSNSTKANNKNSAGTLLPVSQTNRVVTAVYSIVRFVIHGFVHDTNNNPCDGLPLMLFGSNTTHSPINIQSKSLSEVNKTPVSSTVVMRNEGYFQLNARTPGVSVISISPYIQNYASFIVTQPKSLRAVTADQSHKCESQDDMLNGALFPSSSRKNVFVHISSWDGVVTDLIVNGLERERHPKRSTSGTKSKLLSEQSINYYALARQEMNKKNNIYFKTESVLSKKLPAQKKSETINIFTICSGHLYERLAKIMMTSVLNNTHSPVKFWFIGAVTSPRFRDVLPLMAKELNFEYQFVDYVWPTGIITQPTTRMRTVWAMKILFLDVLFPVELNRIIFVDADNICKTDMIELMNMDFKGAPYAFTPFCSNRPEMKPFRFWEVCLSFSTLCM